MELFLATSVIVTTLFFCNRYIDARYAVVSIDRNCRLFWQEEVDPVVLPFVQLWLFVTERQCIIVRI